MNAMSNNFKPDLFSPANVGDDSMYSTAGTDSEQDELTTHIADKKTQKIGRMVEVMVVLFVVAVITFAIYKVFISF